MGKDGAVSHGFLSSAEWLVYASQRFAMIAYLTLPAGSPYFRSGRCANILQNSTQISHSMHFSGIASMALVAALAADNSSPTKPSPDQTSAAITWHDNYHPGMHLAQERGKLALIWFFNPRDLAANERFERDVLSHPVVAALIAERCVAIRLPADVKVTSGESELGLLDHAAFAEMQRSPGIALLDLTDHESPLYRTVVSVFPFARRPITTDKLTVLLDLPRGTLTQRTLIFAVRTHPEHPASATSHHSPLLAHETESHAVHQANITLQGHHQWESRFHSINARLPSGLVTQEVCAESWPGQSLVEAAEECVDSWRQSSGHWSAVSRRHVLFGYDMKRGRNGVWYAAGIFAHKL